MELEEKIAALSPNLRAELERYADFLISRENEIAEEGSETPVFRQIMPEQNRGNVRGKLDPTGIILAEEDINLNKVQDAIDFADINSRFEKENKKVDKEEEKPPRPSRWKLDWI